MGHYARPTRDHAPFERRPSPTDSPQGATTSSAGHVRRTRDPAPFGRPSSPAGAPEVATTGSAWHNTPPACDLAPFGRRMSLRCPTGRDHRLGETQRPPARDPTPFGRPPSPTGAPQVVTPCSTIPRPLGDDHPPRAPHRLRLAARQGPRPLMPRPFPSEARLCRGLHHPTRRPLTGQTAPPPLPSSVKRARHLRKHAMVADP